MNMFVIKKVFVVIRLLQLLLLLVMCTRETKHARVRVIKIILLQFGDSFQYEVWMWWWRFTCKWRCVWVCWPKLRRAYHTNAGLSQLRQTSRRSSIPYMMHSERKVHILGTFFHGQRQHSDTLRKVRRSVMHISNYMRFACVQTFKDRQKPHISSRTSK